MTVLIVLACVVAAGAALRSTWSPCGLSMLSTITPLAEASRGRRWGLTAAWFVLGATLGGATLGLLAAGGAALVGALGPAPAVALGAVAVAALTTASMDAGIGTEMPHHRRQVDEAWLDQFRSWVYGVGFGWQIGTGLATYIMTAAVYLTVVAASLTGRPATAMAVCVLFGLLRGLAILAGARLTDPERLRRFHRRFDLAGPPVRRAVMVLQVVVAVVAALAAAGPAWALAAAAAGGALVVVGSRRSVGLPAAERLAQNDTWGGVAEPSGAS